MLGMFGQLSDSLIFSMSLNESILLISSVISPSSNIPCITRLTVLRSLPGRASFCGHVLFELDDVSARPPDVIVGFASFSQVHLYPMY